VTLSPACALFELEQKILTTGDRKEYVVNIGRKPGGNKKRKPRSIARWRFRRANPARAAKSSRR
jgi:hypothetical protein